MRNRTGRFSQDFQKGLLGTTDCIPYRFAESFPRQLAVSRLPVGVRQTVRSGPRTPQGKARSSQNARKHCFTASTFAVVRLEDLDEIAHLRADLIAVYQPVNSQEFFAIERLALTRDRQSTRWRQTVNMDGMVVNTTRSEICLA